jgi:hypothetical protein
MVTMAAWAAPITALASAVHHGTTSCPLGGTGRHVSFHLRPAWDAASRLERRSSAHAFKRALDGTCWATLQRPQAFQVRKLYTSDKNVREFHQIAMMGDEVKTNWMKSFIYISGSAYIYWMPNDDPTGQSDYTVQPQPVGGDGGSPFLKWNRYYIRNWVIKPDQIHNYQNDTMMNSIALWLVPRMDPLIWFPYDETSTCTWFG